MRIFLLIIVSTILFVSQLASAQDHLEPEVSIMYAVPTAYDYCQNLNTLFFNKTPSGYLARMFCRPGNEPQWCVTVYEDKDKGCTVEYSLAEKRISHGKDSLNIKVKKVTQPIDLETARLVQEVFLRMLRGVRYPDQESDGGDGDEFMFSRNVGWGLVGFDRNPGNSPRGSEQGHTYEPEEGTLTRNLVDVGEALKRFAIAESEEKRNKIRDEIRRKAKELETKLRPTVEPK